MRNKKIISILFISLLLIAITVFIINSKFNNYETSIASQQDDSIIEDNKCLSISEIKKNIDSDKIFYIYSAYNCVFNVLYSADKVALLKVSLSSNISQLFLFITKKFKIFVSLSYRLFINTVAS